jgi:hypothetical protein
VALLAVVHEKLNNSRPDHPATNHLLPATWPQQASLVSGHDPGAEVRMGQPIYSSQIDLDQYYETVSAEIYD